MWINVPAWVVVVSQRENTTHLFFTDKLPIVNRDSGRRRTLNNVVILDYIILYYTGCSRLKGKVSFFLTDLEVA